MKQETVWVVSNVNEQKFLPLQVEKVNNLNDLPAQSPYAIVLTKSENQSWETLLAEFRAKKEYRYTPVFAHGEVEKDLLDLFDGPADESLIAKAAQIHEKLTLLAPKIYQSDDQETILLAYLFSRTSLRLRGYVSHRSPFLYEYPLLSVLHPKTGDFDSWSFLQDLVMRDLLTPDALIDEIQTCSSCESGLLNFKKSCPSCRSIDIKPQQFVYCYACGKIGPVPEFLRQDRLTCSHCNNRLSEIGVDYEKPPENKLCNRCKHCFAEPIVEMVCLLCQRTSLADKLFSRRLYNYLLTARSEYLVQGIEKELYHNFNQFFKAIDYQTFIAIINWQAKLAERYSNTFFCVMTLQVTNENELIQQEGTVNTERIMAQFFTSLRQIFRESDLSARLEGTMFFFLPMTPQEGCLILLERIKQAVEHLSENTTGIKPAISISYITSAEIINGALHGELVASELYTRMVESNVCIIGKN